MNDDVLITIRRGRKKLVIPAVSWRLGDIICDANGRPLRDKSRRSR